MRDATPRFRPDKILRTLENHGVRYVVIGNLGAVLHGSPGPRLTLPARHSH